MGADHQPSPWAPPAAVPAADGEPDTGNVPAAVPAAVLVAVLAAVLVAVPDAVLVAVPAAGCTAHALAGASDATDAAPMLSEWAQSGPDPMPAASAALAGAAAAAVLTSATEACPALEVVEAAGMVVPARACHCLHRQGPCS